MSRRYVLTIGGFTLAFMFAVTLSASAQTILRVDADASGAADGTSWANAYPNLQDALDKAESDGGAFEIWVAEGTYRPTERTDSGDARTATFQLLDQVALYGGFDGSELNRSGRNPDPVSNGTTLSGDIGSEGFAGDDAYHVVTASGTQETAILDGFTITKGRANGADLDEQDGAGIFNENGSPTLSNCLVTGNTAEDDGGGMYNFFESDPVVTSCTFRDNSAGFGGGGIKNSSESMLRLTDVVFENNTAGLTGGGLSNFDSQPILVDVVFRSNTADFAGGGLYNSFNSAVTLLGVRLVGNEAGDGGGIYNDDSDPVLVNTIISGNKAEQGGGIYNDTSDPQLINVTISGNLADAEFISGDGGGMYNTDESFPQIRNVVIWGNAASDEGSQIFLDGSGQTLVSHSLVEGGLPSEAFDDGGNRTGDPSFESNIDPSNAPTTSGNLRVLTDGSPVLDAGSNAALPDDTYDLDSDGNTSEPLPVDLEGKSRRIDNNNDGALVVDVGAYEAPASVLPVELVAFEAAHRDGDVTLHWRTASETNNAGFHVERMTGGGSFHEIGFVEGEGTTSQPRSYRFTDDALPFEADRVSYRLRQVDHDGTHEISDLVEVELGTPEKLNLFGTFPNPARSRATVRYELPRAAQVHLHVYDATGRLALQIANEHQPPGHKEISFRTQGLASGVYFLRLRVGERVISRKLTVVR